MRLLAFLGLVVATSLTGCEKEPTMFEKCFDAEKGKLEKLFESESFSFGYMRDLHELMEDMFRRHMALDLAKIVELDEQEIAMHDALTEKRDLNPLYQTYERFFDQWRETNSADPEYGAVYDLYYQAKQACEKDSDCYIYVFDHPDMTALRQQNPERAIWDDFESQSNEIMRGRDWTSLVGKDFELTAAVVDDFAFNFFSYPERSCLEDMKEAFEKKASLECEREWMRYWLAKFEQQKAEAQVASLATFESSAREICNTRGLYE